MSFLITKVNNFDVTKGYKAYSYCGTVCKRYLLLKRTQDMKHTEKTVSYDDMFGGTNKDNRVDEESTLPFYTEVIDQTIEEVKDMLLRADEIGLSENEEKVGYALVEMLTNWDELFTRIESRKFNKTSAQYFISEYTALTPKEVRSAMKRYKDVYLCTKETIAES